MTTSLASTSVFQDKISCTDRRLEFKVAESCSVPSLGSLEMRKAWILNLFLSAYMKLALALLRAHSISKLIGCKFWRWFVVFLEIYCCYVEVTLKEGY